MTSYVTTRTQHREKAMIERHRHNGVSREYNTDHDDVIAVSRYNATMQLRERRDHTFYNYDTFFKKITPLSFDQAKAWARANTSEQTYIETFYPSAQSTEKASRIDLRVTDKAKAQLKRLCRTSEQTYSEVIEVLIDEAYQGNLPICR